jgi:amidase
MRFFTWVVGFFMALTQTLGLTAEPNRAGFSGAWQVTVQLPQATTAAVLTISEEQGRYRATSGPLDEIGYFPLEYDGQIQNGRLMLTPRLDGPIGSGPVGTLTLQLQGGTLRGTGTLYRVPVTLTGTRPVAGNAAPKTYDYTPATYVVRLSAGSPPVLRIRPGDTVRTTTLDANGQNEQGQWAWMPGNTQTGPFYIEGSMPGDTLVVHLNRVRVNQTRAEMVCFGIIPNALIPAYSRSPPAPCEFHWILDGAHGVGRPEKPSPRLRNFSVNLRPMIGTIGVAPPGNQAIGASDLGNYGGNLDYNQIGEGTTVYLPVYSAGALLSLGDAHALQGDGELTGQGLETTMSVEFTVDLIKGKTIGRPWEENADYIMVSGIGNSLDDALRAATTGMSDWLTDRYKLDQTDLAMLLGTSIHYDIAEVVDPRPHVVAKVRKDVLAQLEPH